MLPIISTPSASLRRVQSKKIEAVHGVSIDKEALSGEWQRASPKAEHQSHQTFDGELVHDEQAVYDYLAAAGEQVVILPGQIISVFA